MPSGINLIVSHYKSIFLRSILRLSIIALIYLLEAYISLTYFKNSFQDITTKKLETIKKGQVYTEKIKYIKVHKNKNKLKQYTPSVSIYNIKSQIEALKYKHTMFYDIAVHTYLIEPSKDYVTKVKQVNFNVKFSTKTFEEAIKAIDIIKNIFPLRSEIMRAEFEKSCSIKNINKYKGYCMNVRFLFVIYI